MEGLGAFIRSLRDERDLSLREFAKKLNCSAAFISDLELGRRHPSETMLTEMARILGVDVEVLRAQDTRPPIEDIKSITQADPRWALAFRTVIDKKITAEEMLEFVQREHRHKSRSRK
jgi:transcriptional regulator with XRE-family HTH domain